MKVSCEGSHVPTQEKETTITQLSPGAARAAAIVLTGVGLVTLIFAYLRLVKLHERGVDLSWHPFATVASIGGGVMFLGGSLAPWLQSAGASKRTVMVALGVFLGLTMVQAIFSVLAFRES